MFEISLLRSFLAVAQARSFTQGAAALGLSQPAVSQQVRRLEAAAGQRLLRRDTGSVSLTTDGAVMERYAAEILALHDQAAAYFDGGAGEARVRLGVSEDLALTKLPWVLRRLTGARSRLRLELSVGLTSVLYPMLDGGRLDLVLAKRRAGDARGELVRREPLVWMAHRDLRLASSAPAPLVGYPRASITTRLAVEALERAGRPWRMACASETLSGIWCGLQAGLGVSAQVRLLLETGGAELAACGPEARLPPLEAVDYVLLGRSARLHGAVAEVALVMRGLLQELWATPAFEGEQAAAAVLNGRGNLP